MAVLLLNRLQPNRADFDEWLHDYGRPVVMLSPSSVIGKYAVTTEHLGYLDYASSLQLEADAIRANATYGFTSLVALEEGDVLRAARVRTQTGIKGQSFDSATAFRDKFVMKQILRRHGVKVARHALIASPADAITFCKVVGWPVVLKPRTGVSSMGTRIVTDQVALLKALESIHDLNDLLLEEFVKGQMYHVDGIVENGELVFISTAVYINSCISYMDSLGSGSIILPQDLAIGERLKTMALQALSTLPTPQTTAFHAEIFWTPADELVLCEIASRAPGALVPNLIEASYGINVNRYVTRSVLDLPNEAPPAGPRYLTASFHIPPRHGTLLSIPESVPFKWCLSYEKNAQIGDAFNGPQRSLHSYANIIVKGLTVTEVAQRIKAATEFVEAHTKWHDSQG